MEGNVPHRSCDSRCSLVRLRELGYDSMDTRPQVWVTLEIQDALSEVSTPQVLNPVAWNDDPLP